MELKTPNQKITAALYVNSLGYLKTPAEVFAKIIYDDHEFFYEQIVKHKNTSTIKKISEKLTKPELIKLMKYLWLIIPISYSFRKSEIIIIEIQDWEQFIIDYKSYFFLYKIDKNINKSTFIKIKNKLESTYSTSWQTSLSRIIKWPTTDAPLGLEQFFPKGWQETGLLSSSGYIVGKSGATEAGRRLILSNLVENDIKLASFKKSYVNSWGKSNSLERLLKIARTIAALCRNAKGSPNDFKKAIEEWENDLDFLKEKYFYTFLNLNNEKWPNY